MFNNIGGKIKALAEITCWIGIILSIVLGLFIMTMDDDAVLLGIAACIVGPLISWISSFLLYGFGQLVENSDIIAESIKPTATPDEILDTHIAHDIENDFPTEEPYSEDTFADYIKPQDISEEASFKDYVKVAPTKDLQLILEDQKELFSEEEINVIKEELTYRTAIQ